ncbi:MAG: hypothetical protein NTU43_04485 [Bacteroidetes bacterium]|nr:hypothetical protein [Bacteroidota bacterium]
MKTKSLLLLSLLVLLIQSCTKDTNNGNTTPKNTYYYLTEAQLNQTPYFTNPAFDTISFASDKGDTLTFVKAKTDTTWYCEPANYNPDNHDQNCYQTLHNTYTTIKGNGSFDVKHSKDGFGYYNYSISDLVIISFYNLQFLVRDFRIGSKNGTFFYDSINKGNKIYNNSIKIYHNLNDSLTGESFINKDFGVFSIKNNQTNTEFNYLTK